MGFLDALAGTFTFGQCNSHGCGGSHRGNSGFNPLGAVVNKIQGVSGSSGSSGGDSGSDDADTQQAIQDILKLVGLGVAGLLVVVIVINLLFKII